MSVHRTCDFFPSYIILSEILFSVHGRLRKIKMYTHPDGTKKGDALVSFLKAESVLPACHRVRDCATCPLFYILACNASVCVGVV